MNVTQLNNQLKQKIKYLTGEDTLVVRGLHINIVIDKINEIIDSLNDDTLTKIDKIKIFDYPYRSKKDTDLMRNIHLKEIISKINEMIVTESLSVSPIDTNLINNKNYKTAIDITPVRKFHLDLVTKKINQIINTDSWSSYWTHQSEVLFFGLYSEISGGQMPNKVDGGATFLTVAGAAGSETYQCPNTAPYIAADTDYIWFKEDTVQRTVSTAELIGYDLQRTPVKYTDDAPNVIEAVIILNSTLSAAKLLKLHHDFRLPILWSGVWIDDGYEKSNRSLSEQYLWTPESVWCAEYDSVLAAMPTKPLTADKVIQNTMLKALVDGGYYAKAKVLDIFAVHNIDSSNINWKSPGTFNPTVVGSPTWTQYKSYLGATGKYVNLNFNPAVDGGGDVVQDSICFICGAYNDGTKRPMGGTNDSVPWLNVVVWHQGVVYASVNDANYVNSTNVGAGHGHYGVSRDPLNVGNILILYNQSTFVRAAASIGLMNNATHTCGRADGASHPAGQVDEIPYAFIFTGLTETEMKAVVTIMETYLDNYGFGLY